MKKYISIFACIIILATFLALSTSAETITGECGTDATYTLDTTTGVLVISGSGNIADFASYDAMPWYPERSYIKSVVIENGIESIGNYSFHSCTNITSVSLPATLNSIRHSVFTGCSSLSTISIPQSVISIGAYAFAYCYNISDIVIPNAVTSIGDMAFYYCYNLKSITIPSSVTSIGDYAFAYCYSIIVSCYKDSYADTYAAQNKLTVSYLTPEPILGDVDGNGILDVFDVLVALKALLNGTSLDGVDISGDDKLTLIDVIQLLKTVTA